MNKRERVLKGWYKFKKRLINIGLWNEKDKPENNLNCYTKYFYINSNMSLI